MSSEMQHYIRSMPNEDLIAAYNFQKREFTEEALMLMEQEIDERNLDPKEAEELYEKAKETRTFEPEEFVQFAYTFSRTDIPLAVMALREKKIPFLVDTAATSDALPLDSEAAREYHILVHQEYCDEAKEELGHLFQHNGDRLTAKDLPPADRLKSVNFYELRLTEAQLEEEVSVKLSHDESRHIIELGKQVLEHADEIEQRIERPLFYYDNIEELIDSLQNDLEAVLSVADLLAILEIVQVSCDREAFDEAILPAAVSVLEFIESISGA
ncbi:MAG: hypothetical protein GF398_20100 [Chitinivibrionales bacterium]|nr:hypothetical protein [Chitinivibrionales bacterium]